MGNLVGLFFCLNIVYQFENNKNQYVKIFNVFILYVFFFIFLKLFESRSLYLFSLIAIYLNLNYLFLNIKSKSQKIIINYILVLSAIILIFYLNKTDFFTSWVFYDLKYFYKIYVSETKSVGLHASRLLGWIDLLPNDIFHLLFGIGITSYEQRFLDNGVLFLILNIGIVPLLLLTIFCVKNFKFTIHFSYSLKFLFYFVILFNLLISEFFLVSRYIFIVIIIYFLFQIKSQTFISNHK